MDLRPYQLECKNSVFNAWQTHDKVLGVLPTGTGKTIIFCKIIEDATAQGKRSLVLAHRDELIRQAQDKLVKSTGLGCSIEKAEETALGEWYRVTAGSVQTLMRPKRLKQFPKDFYDVIIVDEAHHVLADSYRRVLDYFDKAKVLGVTATPDRGDKKNLGEYFESIAYEYTLPKAIKDGYLSKIKALTIPLEIDLGKLSTQAGDYKLSELDDKLAPYLEAIAKEMKEYCRDRKTLVFLPLINTSKAFTELLNSMGFSAAEINGNSQDRQEVLKDFSNGKYNVLCNSMLLTEGYDEPSIDCIVCLRPTKVRSLYAQIVGRGTRLYPGKDHLLLLDFLWHTEKHELCRPAHLIASNEKIAEKMIENMEEEAKKGCGEIDIELAEDAAKNDVVAEREAALANLLSEQRKRKRALVDPVQFAFSINSEDLIDYEPSMMSEMAPPSQKQVETLGKYGIFPDEIKNSGYASKLLERLNLRRTSGLTSPKQIRLLERYGFKQVGMWDFSEATKLINRIAANRWHIPTNINPNEYKPEALYG